ncbi:nucleoside-diphosphate kinase [Furfurilactobacillus sp. WILCCON 0119]|uniref:nucleoside-diphosphate kinase n=1 Tax=Furfurilactobacillus entadae TaxID=2922307 RepID=UPI0035EDCD21
MTEERTLILVKPDGVEGGHVGQIITRLEQHEYGLSALKVVTKATDAQLRQHYADKVDEPYFPGLVAYMQSGPIVAMVVSGTNIISEFRRMAGATNPGEAAIGTIRGDFGREWNDGAIRNVVHSSDSEAAASRETAIWFPELTASPESETSD